MAKASGWADTQRRALFRLPFSEFFLPVLSLALLFGRFVVILAQMGEATSVGGQIRRLREQAGLTVSDLAEAAGLDNDALHSLEGSGQYSESATIFRIAEFLKVSPIAILEPDSLPGRLPVATRTNGDGVSDATAWRLTSLAELHHVLSLDGHHAAISASIGEAPQRRSAQTLREHADDLARWANGQLEFPTRDSSRLVDLASVVESRFGVDVMVETREEGAPLGASITDPKFPFILINADQPAPRALFTLAHELGHVLNQDGHLLHVDRDFRGSTDSERLANAFAAAFLMPTIDVVKVIDKYGRGAESLACMLLRFSVSYESLIYRLHNLKYINTHGRDRLKQAGWAGLVHALADNDLSRALLSARSTKLARRPPSLLTKRCWNGVMQGTVSVRPLAGLLEEDSSALLEKIKAVGPESTDTVNGDYSSPVDSEEAAQSASAVDPVTL